jgi:uncharacterized protein YcfJ
MRNIKLNVGNTLRVSVLAPVFVAAVFASPAMAEHQYADSARVLSVTPQTERVNVPRQECHTEYQQQSNSNANQHSIMGAVIGGVAGGLLGNTIGRGNGRVAAAAVGAGVGAIAGDRIASSTNNRLTTRTVPVETCYQVDNWQNVNAGYLVTYAYNGRTYSTVTGVDPGDYIDVHVTVAPSSRVVSQVNYIEPAYYDKPHWNNSRPGDKRRDREARDSHGQNRYY